MWMKENRGGYNWSQRIADLTAEEWGSRSHRCKRGGGKRRAGMRQSRQDRCGVSLRAHLFLS
jgi:hypothetical protein